MTALYNMEHTMSYKKCTLALSSGSNYHRVGRLNKLGMARKLHIIKKIAGVIQRGGGEPGDDLDYTCTLYKGS